MGVLDAPAIDRAARWRQPRVIPVATRANPPGLNNQLSDGVATAGTYRVKHYATASPQIIRVAFSNYYNLNGVEQVGPNSFSLRAALESSGQFYPLWFSGLRDVILAPGSTVWSDPIGFPLTQGSPFWSRSFVSVQSAGMKWPAGAVVAQNVDAEGTNAGVGAADLTTSGTVPTSGGSFLFGPSAIWGQVGTAVPVIGVIGDSISVGQLDSPNDVGYIARALGTSYNYQRLGFGQATVAAFNLPQYFHRRAQLLAPCTHILSQVGVNDHVQTSSYLEGALTQLWNAWAAMGMKVYQCTISPVSTSTDGYATLGNQTSTSNPTIATVNAWLRTVPAPLSGVFDVAAAVESSVGSGIWNVGMVSPADGTHPTQSGHIAMAALLDPTVFRL